MSEPTPHPLLVSDAQLDELIRLYCRDRNAAEKAGRFDPVTGRDAELEDMILVLLQKGRKNVMLLAPPGVGKTAMLVALAQAVVQDKVPDYLKNARVLEVDLASMAAGTSSPAEFQGRFVPLCRGVAERYHRPEYPKFILFIDEFHTIMPSVESSAYRGLSEVLKPFLTVGDLHVVGATTLDEYRLFVSSDNAVDRRFQKLELTPPDIPQTVRILESIAPGYERHHRIKIPLDVLQKIVKQTDALMKKRFQPDKSIVILDAACAYHVRNHGTGGELTMESVNSIISKQTGVHAKALAD